MALRDELNVPTRPELYSFVLAEGQAITVLGASAAGDIAAELWYYSTTSTATDDGVTVIQPTAIPPGNPGRYLLWIYNSDWNYLINKPTIPSSPVNADWNSVGGLSQVLNKPSIPSAQVNCDWNSAGGVDELLNKPTIPSTTTQVSEGTNLYYTAARFNTAFSAKSTSDLTEGSNQYFTNTRARSAISLTTTGTSGAATYSSGTGILNIPNYATPVTPTINSTVSRSLSNAAGSTNQFTISASRNARVYYSINVTWNISALLSTASTVLLEFSTNSGSSWTIVSQVSKNINLGLLQSGNDDLNLSGEIPANALVRIRPSVSTNSTITYVTGQEVLY